VIGVLLVLFGVLRTSLAKTSSFKCGFWSAALGVVIVVLCLFGICGYNNTCYLPSVADMQSSLTIYNSSSTEFTLRTMACVTVLLPFVVAYIAYVWHKMTSPAITADELHKEEHIY
jgi:cytochrome d ubiquinol oxidase subunit II